MSMISGFWQISIFIESVFRYRIQLSHLSFISVFKLLKRRLERMWLQSRWRFCWRWRVSILCPISEILSCLVFFIVVSELWSWHNCMLNWHVHVMFWYKFRASSIVEEVHEFLKCFYFCKPFFIHKVSLDLLVINWYTVKFKLFTFDY